VPNNSNPGAAAKNWRTMRTPAVVDVFRVPKPGASIYQSQVAPAIQPVIIYPTSRTAFWIISANCHDDGGLVGKL